MTAKQRAFFLSVVVDELIDAHVRRDSVIDVLITSRTAMPLKRRFDDELRVAGGGPRS